MTAPTGRVLAVNTAVELPAGPYEAFELTAIDKHPVEGPVHVHALGVDGDRQVNRKHHGGRDQAVYAFAREDMLHWERELARTIRPGTFGENLTLEGIEVSDAVVGERWRIGGDRADAVILETTLPRTPCSTFADWMGEARWVKTFSAYGRVGTYLRVIQPGAVAAGDVVEVVHEPGHGVTIGEVFRGLSREAAASLRKAGEAGDVELAGKTMKKIERALR